MGLVVLLSCETYNVEDAHSLLPTDKNPIEFNIGDSWLYKRYFINVGLKANFDLPDTLVGYSFFKVTKDTVINSLNYYIVEGKDYEVGKDEVVICKKRQAYHLSDSGVSEYTFKDSEDGYISGIMKVGNTQPLRFNKKTYSTMWCKQAMLAKLMTNTNYDATVFKDFTYPIRFPLNTIEPYIYRDEGDPSGNSYYRKRYTGQEKMETAAGIFTCYVLEWLTKEAFSANDITFIDYVSRKGLIKRYIDGGVSEVQDSLGNPLDSLHNYDITVYVGTEDIDADTLLPWGKR